MRSFLALLLGLAVLASAFASPWQPLTAMALSPDGHQIATGGLTGEVLWRDAKTGEVLGVASIPTNLPIVALSFADEQRLLLVDARGDAYQIHLGSSEVAPLPSIPPALGEAWKRWRTEGPTMSGTVWQRGGWEARGDPTGRISLTSPTGEVVSWQAHDAAVTGLAVSADGSRLYSCSFDGGLAVWLLPSGKNLFRL